MLLFATMNPGRQRPYFFTASNGAKYVSDCGILAIAITTELEKGGRGCSEGESSGAQGFFDRSIFELAADEQPGDTSKPAATTASTTTGTFLPNEFGYVTASFCCRQPGDHNEPFVPGVPPSAGSRLCDEAFRVRSWRQAESFHLL